MILHPEAHVFRVKQVHGNRVLRTSEVRLSSLASQLPDDTDFSLSVPAILHPSSCGNEEQKTRDKGQIINDQGQGTKDEGQRTKDQGQGTKDQGQRTKDDYPAADGLVTDAAHQAVWACSADCTPVLIADERSGQVAAVHSGWRGTAQKIVLEAIWRLVEQGSQLADLRVALGPAIAGEVYQVGKDVAAETGATLVSTPSDVVVEEVLAALSALPDPPILPDSDPDRVRLDVRRVIALQLEQLGLSPEQVAIAPHCTYQQPEWFFSYRRDRQKQIQWSGIVSR